jgi:ABC-type branched-subunit amino acid transport system substrate-binding protein
MQPSPALTRRDLCRRLALACSLPLVAGCAASRRLAGGLTSRFTGGGDAALLLPLTGDGAAIGRNMSRAASLVVPPEAEGGLPVFDTQDTVAGARASAEQALEGGARLLLGPLRADQTPSVVEAAGDLPVVSFSNDDRLAARGAFVMGITPAQSVATAFSYARAQGVRRVAVVAAPGPLGEATIAAARQLAAAGGLTLSAALTRDSGAPGLVADLRSASGGTLPDAVFLPDGGGELTAFAGALAGAGPRLMGGVQWGVLDVAAVPGLEGSWFAAPPPASFVPFLDAFEVRFGEAAGVVTALGHDAALMAATLDAAGAMNRAGLTREEGFDGALGGFRFLDDGRCLRDLAVLTVEAGEVVAIGEVAET